TRVIRQQPLLHSGVPRAVQALPFLEGNEDGRLLTASGDELRTLLQARVQQFAEARLGILNRPSFHSRVLSWQGRHVFAVDRVQAPEDEGGQPRHDRAKDEEDMDRQY